MKIIIASKNGSFIFVFILEPGHEFHNDAIDFISTEFKKMNYNVLIDTDSFRNTLITISWN